jgi:hypothetical protein
MVVPFFNMLAELYAIKKQPSVYVQILCFWTSSIVLFIFQNTTFQRLDSVFVFRLNLLSWAQSIELVPISIPCPVFI